MVYWEQIIWPIEEPVRTGCAHLKSFQKLKFRKMDVWNIIKDAMSNETEDAPEEPVKIVRRRKRRPRQKTNELNQVRF